MKKNKTKIPAYPSLYRNYLKLSEYTARSCRLTAAFALVILMVIGGLARGAGASTDYNQQIQALRDQNAQNRDKVSTLQTQATSYQDAIARLQSSINDIQAQLAASRANQDRLQSEIVALQTELDLQRGLLGESIKTMYVDGQISTIEMLATSKNLSEFVDKEEYRNMVQKKIQQSLLKISKLQAELKIRKQKIDDLVEIQKTQEAQLAADKAQQADLLAYTEAQKNDFSSKIASNENKISELQAAQDAINRLIARNSSGKLVSQGKVNAGDQIGRMGSTGFSTGVHTHFAAQNASGGYIDPFKSGFGWPTPGSEQWQVSQPFGCTDQYGEPRDPSCPSGLTHQGVDIWGNQGAPIVAGKAGDIIFNDCSSSLPGYSRPGLGQLVVIQHPDGTTSWYAHMMTPGGRVFGNYC